MSSLNSASLSPKSGDLVPKNGGIRFLIGSPDNAQTISLNDIAKARLCTVSGFIKSASNPHWACGRSGTIDLTADPDTTVTLFQLFVAWAVNGDLAASPPFVALPHGIECNLKGVHAHLRLLVDAWLLGDRLLCEGFMNATMDLLVGNLSMQYTWGRLRQVPCALIQHVYRKTSNHNGTASPLRRVLCDFAAADAYMTTSGIRIPGEANRAFRPHRCKRCASGRGAAIRTEWQLDLFCLALRALVEERERRVPPMARSNGSCYSSRDDVEDWNGLLMPWIKRVCEYRTYRNTEMRLKRGSDWGCCCPREEYIRCHNPYEKWEEPELFTEPQTNSATEFE